MPGKALPGDAANISGYVGMDNAFGQSTQSHGLMISGPGRADSLLDIQHDSSPGLMRQWTANENCLTLMTGDAIVNIYCQHCSRSMEC
jgi:hypothetical protein